MDIIDPVAPDRDPVTLLEVSERFTRKDRQRHHKFPFQVPRGVDAVVLRFRWGPLTCGRDNNLLSLSVFDSEGFRGTAHRESTEEESTDIAITIAASAATEGFIAGPVRAGSWVAVVDAHEVLNDGLSTGPLLVSLRVAGLRQDKGAGSLPGKTTSPVLPTSEPVRTAKSSQETLQRGDGGQERWYVGDLHSHTVHSDGSCTVPDRIRAAVTQGLDYLAITDHNTTSHIRTTDTWPPDLLRIRGTEVTTFNGHFNVFGLSNWVDWYSLSRGSTLTEIQDQVEAGNALMVINHPNAIGNPYCTGCRWDYIRTDFTRLDGIEVWNGPWTTPDNDNEGALALWTDLLSAGVFVTAVAGSDSHHADDCSRGDLPFTHVYASSRSEAHVLEAIRAGRAYMSSGPTIAVEASTADGRRPCIPGSGMWPGPFDLHVVIEGLQSGATLRVVCDGENRESTVVEPVERSIELPALRADSWWRLELREGRDEDGSLVLVTNPVRILNQGEAQGKA